jgi:hypothetical protein
MLRALTAAILIVCLLAGNICAGTDHPPIDRHDTAGCSVAAGCDLDAHPCNSDEGGSHGDHCCDTHSHLQAITGQSSDYSHPLHEKQFTAIIPHLTPQDFSRIPFIPPRSIS